MHQSSHAAENASDNALRAAGSMLAGATHGILAVIEKQHGDSLGIFSQRQREGHGRADSQGTLGAVPPPPQQAGHATKGQSGPMEMHEQGEPSGVDQGVSAATSPWAGDGSNSAAVRGQSSTLTAVSSSI